MTLLCQRLEAQRTRLLDEGCVVEQVRLDVLDDVDEHEEGVPTPKPAGAVHVEILAVQQRGKA